MKYPKNIYDYFPPDVLGPTENGRSKEFSIWAFGCEKPGWERSLKKCWENLHPEYLMNDSDTLCLCLCKMHYIYQKEKKRKLEEETKLFPVAKGGIRGETKWEGWKKEERE